MIPGVRPTANLLCITHIFRDPAPLLQRPESQVCFPVPLLKLFLLYFSNGPQKTTPLESVQQQPQSDNVDFSSTPMGRTHPVTQRNEALMSC